MITIQTLQGTGVLKIASYPAGATLYLDGDEYGKVPITITNIEPGDYNYTLKLEGYEDYSGKANVKVGELCCEDILMMNGDRSVKCVQAPPGTTIPPPPSGIPGIGPGYLVIPERTIIIVLASILAGIIIWKLLSGFKAKKE